MKIGVLGVGNIGATVARRLSAAGHDVKVANSRGPETVPAAVLETGARAVRADEVVLDVDVLVVSIPLQHVPGIKPVLDRLPAEAVVLDTSNYYPMRDGNIAALDEGQVESEWISEQIGRPVVKAWNAVLSDSFDTKDAPAGTPDRIALPVAADDEAHRAVGIGLVEETGFTGYDAGPLAESWRQQPGTPAYCADLTEDQLRSALADAVVGRAPKRRDLAMSVIVEVTGDPTSKPVDDFILRLNRLLYF
ncbi:NADPH-dependent F420 reductase [Nocardioides alkalitolerans]|uniref:NADPH-dependent F420 reductase n=1 Tax=Nocardioides alkalitolerans TaxID=281714 RepID=UPI0004046EF8|nr:NAD(P)-binding domain-containing protein [Nocardioides alkalitolerans]